jgi:hypothetical protein
MARPTTESTVSMIDQVLMVWPTDIRKYWLTSQKPGPGHAHDDDRRLW